MPDRTAHLLRARSALSHLSYSPGSTTSLPITIEKEMAGSEWTLTTYLPLIMRAVYPDERHPQQSNSFDFTNHINLCGYSS
ncbi:protein of unknown function [Vibrio tapetis subsp. tapetis]|uniref:Uncharacterized protein n=1 Tax=Vibrio tapetis subsp. tapetis TaxID=1671868 RepID=A0A2N8ZHC7_9VIBR|nr:protein of unknown function [Vibrio tapetis subsp. tapetis]